MNKRILVCWGLTLAALCISVGCHRPNEALVHQMEELRKELADLKKVEKKGLDSTSETIARPAYPASQPAYSQHSASASLPVVRLAPERTRPQDSWAPQAPVAKALRPKDSLRNGKKLKAKRKDIVLPTPDIPAMVFQTLDEYGQIHEQGRLSKAEHTTFSDSYYEDSREMELSVLGPAKPIDAPALVSMNAPRASAPKRAPAPPKAVEREQAPPYSRALTPESHPMTLVSSAHVEMDNPRDLGQAEQLYQRGMAALKEKKYGYATQAFQELLDTNPEDALADNALYWLGESNYDQGKFQKALTLFQDVLRRFPLGNKVPDAMVKVGLCFQNLGKMRQARQILEQVMAIYPESHAAGVAASRLPTM